MTESNLIETCLQLAVTAHKGQLDKVNLPVILHPLTVGLSGATPDEICVGFLHDTVEDTDVTPEKILAAGVPQRIVDAVMLLTHDKSIPYFDYVQALIDSGNKLAIAAKRNDLKHNHSRAIKYGFKEQEKKCAKALEMIEQSGLLNE